MISPSSKNFDIPIEEDLFDYAYEEPGSMPGTLNIEEHAKPSEIVLIDYNGAYANHLSNLTTEDCRSYLETNSVSWVDIQGLGTADILQQLGEVFNLHPLIDF